MMTIYKIQRESFEEIPEFYHSDEEYYARYEDALERFHELRKEISGYRNAERAKEELIEGQGGEITYRSMYEAEEDWEVRWDEQLSLRTVEVQ